MVVAKVPEADQKAKWFDADWRAWIALVWALGFGLLYANMVWEQRGGKIRAAINALSK